jgi:hypothetical protein
MTIEAGGSFSQAVRYGKYFQEGSVGGEQIFLYLERGAKELRPALIRAARDGSS